MKNNTKKLTAFEDLHTDVRRFILQFLNPKQLAQVARVNKQWKTDSEDNRLWQTHLNGILGTDQNFSKELFKKIHLGGLELLEIMKNKKLKQAIEQTLELQKKCKLKYIIQYLFNENVFPQEQISQHRSILKHGFSLVKETDELFDWQRNGHYTILHLLAACSEVHAIRLLQKIGFDVNASGPLWLTPLHIGVLYGRFEVIETLINVGANKAVRSKAWLFETFPRVSPMELAAFMGRQDLLEILYIEKVKMGPQNTELVEDIKNSYTWGGRCFLECLINHFEAEIKKESEEADEKVSIQALIDIYRVKRNFLSECQEDAAMIEKYLEDILGTSNYARMKTLDFFIARGWVVPEWFAKMSNKLQLNEEIAERPQKMPRHW